jgi:hypothetical protein
MERNKMNTENVETTHQDGPAWKIVGRFLTFAEADSKRTKLTEEKDLQVKVHMMGPQTKQFFAVKTRTDPATAAAEVSKKKSKKK